MGLHSFYWSARPSQAVRARLQVLLCLGRTGLCCWERRGKTLQCWRECQKTINTMAWHSVVISSFESFIRRRRFWAALTWHGVGSLCLLLFCIFQAQYHSEVLQLQNQLVNCTAALSGVDPPNNLFRCLMSDQKYSLSVMLVVLALVFFIEVQTSWEICAVFCSICISAASF